ncbi:hypothetical protein QFC21_004813 [Naganishia friedmannii]|uniref:Uncharacterized protein n=1 Tax=Naganishia friedmannii TaxID=89922 RepID=A0ACC2VDB5_9TREE|nr:hypothetical protein QFC21_004813 [Naganishia friedmannii]
MPFFKPKPQPATHRDETVIPDRQANILSRLTFGWIFPLLRTGYSRRLEENDVWRLDEPRLTRNVTDTLERNFYARCPSSQRPLGLRNLQTESHGSTSSSDEEEKRHPEKSITSTQQMQNSSTALGFCKPSADDNQRQHGIQVDSKTSASTLSNSPGSLLLGLSRLNPWSTHRKMQKVSKGPLTIEVDENGTERLYDSSLYMGMFLTVRRPLIYALILRVCEAILNTTSSLVTKKLISYIASSHAWHGANDITRASLSKPASLGHGLGLAFGLALMQQTSSLMFQNSAIRSKGCARIQNTNGRLITAISTDTGFINNAFPFAVAAIADPLVIVVGLVLLLVNLGPSALVGVGILASSSVIVRVLAKVLSDNRQHQLKLVDRRVRLVSEILSAIRQIKLYAYEHYFMQRLLRWRGKELDRVRTRMRDRALMQMIVTLIPTLAAVITFITYSLSGHRLDTATIFASLQLFNLIQGPLRQLPVTFTKLTDAYVALKRITGILVAEEQPQYVTILESAEFAIEAVGDFSFETFAPPDQNYQGTARNDKPSAKEEDQVEQQPFCLENIDLHIRHGAFVCIFGRIGTGKSALLQALVGEMRQTRGYVRFGGNIGLVTQDAWIQNASLKENILFGQELESARLRTVLHACALEQDVKAFPDGVDTEIGERGINLSGGQRSRVALARAAYFDADVILLDDPLSAVDSHVSSHLVEQCFLGVLKDKTRVLVTHHLDVARHADLIIVMDHGRVVQQGSYQTLANVQGTFQTLMQEYGNAQQAQGNEAGCSHKAVPDQTLTSAESQKHGVTKLHIDEERARGTISWAVYLGYLKGLKIGGHTFIAFISLIFGQCCQVGTSIFLGFWAGRNIPGYQDKDYMGLYAGLGVGTAVFIFLIHYHMTMAGVRAGFLMFQTAIHCVLRSPVTFHDRTPSGRIVSRLTKDMSTIDDNLGSLWSFFLSQFLSIFGTIALIAFAYPYLVIGFIPLGILYITFGLFYRHSFRELNRIASITRSFVFSHFGEQISGVSSIRAFQQQKYFLKRMSDAIDYESRFIYLSIVADRWFSSRLDFLGSLLVLGVGVFGVCFRNSVSPTKFAVVFTYTLQTTFLLCELSQRGVWLEMEMNSCERILNYCQLPVEAAPTQSADPDASWPSMGDLLFQDVELRYRCDLPLVLKGLSFHIKPGEKALFRLVELSKGRIIIDGIDLATIGLDTLRQQLSAIPQEPLLFSGTVRTNLDPEVKRTDAELNDSLRRCGLLGSDGATEERLLKFKLDSAVADGGSNFSAGERQLVALCRALVKNSKVLMLDEATSSVDPETDATIQTAIRNEFQDVTLLCIAHRLATIAFYDRVLVLDQGSIVEFDTPLRLYDQETSLFNSMCRAANLSRDAIAASCAVSKDCHTSTMTP